MRGFSRFIAGLLSVAYLVTAIPFSLYHEVGFDYSEFFGRVALALMFAGWVFSDEH